MIDQVKVGDTIPIPDIDKITREDLTIHIASLNYEAKLAGRNVGFVKRGNIIKVISKKWKPSNQNFTQLNGMNIVKALLNSNVDEIVYPKEVEPIVQLKNQIKESDFEIA